MPTNTLTDAKSKAAKPKDKVRSAYNRAEYLPQRRRILQDWADWLDSCEVDTGSAQRRESPSSRAAR